MVTSLQGLAQKSLRRTTQLLPCVYHSRLLRCLLARVLIALAASAYALCAVHAKKISDQVAEGLKDAPRAKLEATILAAVVREKLDMTDLQDILL